MLLSKLTPITVYTIESTRGADGDLIEKYENIFEAICGSFVQAEHEEPIKICNFLKIVI